MFPFNSDNSLFTFWYSVLLSINEIQNFPWFSSINHWPNRSTSLHLANLFLIICFWSLAGNFWPASRTMLVFPKQKSYAPCIRSINYLVFRSSFFDYEIIKKNVIFIWYYIYFYILIIKFYIFNFCNLF